jgi:hypothetical protein
LLTLDGWRAFATGGRKISFPKLELMGGDHDPPVVVGTGEIEMEGFNSFTFHLDGKPEDVGYALATCNRYREWPYEALARLRLFGTDTDGVNWSGGWTTPSVHTSDGNWRFAGDLEALVTDVEGETVPQRTGTELMFPLRIGDPLTISMARFVRSLPPAADPVREYRMRLLESDILFKYEQDLSTLLVTAESSSGLSAPYAEGWLAEPLRILFGQLIYPRLVARNFGNGRAAVWIRRSPPTLGSARWASLIEGEKLIKGDEEFWGLYRGLLEMIAGARDEKGNPNFEQNKITRIFEEIVLASRGSRWIWALSFASSIEAITRMIMPQDSKPAKAELEAIDALDRYIDLYKTANNSEDRIKGITLNAVRRARTVSTIQALRGLQTQGVVSKAQLSAWDDIRNSVAHGSLLSPYSDEIEDGKILELSSLMRTLTRELIKRHAAGGLR